MTTDNITSVNNLNNNSVLYTDNTTARAQSAQTGKLFSTILQAKMNNATMSIASFNDINGTSGNDSGSLFGSSGSSSLFGGDGFGSVFGTSLLSGLFTNGLNGDLTADGTETSGSGINSNTMLMFIFLAMMMNNGNDNSGMGMMMTSLAGALNGRITGKSYMNSFNNQVANSFRGTSLTGSSFKATYVAPGTGSYPSNMSKACSPSIVSNVGSRNANLYRSVVA